MDNILSRCPAYKMKFTADEVRKTVVAARAAPLGALLSLKMESLKLSPSERRMQNE